MKRILFTLSLFALFQIGTAQETWNACNSTVTIIPAPSYDSTFVLSAPSRAALAKGMASWTPSTSSAASYLVYTALLTQTGTDAPVATVLENTLGGTVVWTRTSEGFYEGTLADGFPLNKCVLDPYPVAFLPISSDFPGNNIEGYINITFNSPNRIFIKVYSPLYAFMDWSVIGETFPISIRVYP